MSNTPSSYQITVPDGLAATTLQGLADLLRDITGTAPRAPLYFAPGLIVLLPEVADLMPLPQPTGGMALVQDYQSIRFQDGLVPDVALDVTGTLTPSGASTEYRLTIGTMAETVMALRVLPETELAGALPLRMRALDTSAPITCTSEHVARYLALSLDPNQLHRDVERARALGFTAPVVPGLLLASLIQPEIETQYPDATVRAVRVRFASPIVTDQPFHVALQRRGSDRLRAFLLVDTGAAAIVDLELASPLER